MGLDILRTAFGVLLGLSFLCWSPAVFTAEPAPQDGASTRTGTIQGRVVFQGDPIPRPTEIENGTDPEACGSRQSYRDFLISPQTRGIQNVVVSLGDVTFPSLPSPQPTTVTIDNRDCQFVPHVSVLTAGSTIEAANSDPISHTTHLYYGPLDRNLALATGEKMTQLVSRPGLILVRCDIHGWMKAYVHVDRHPFHAVSDTSGQFAIRDIPVGSYTLQIWHEALGRQQVPVTVRARQTETLEIRYRK